MERLSTDSSTPAALWRESDRLKIKAMRRRQEADALDRAAERLDAMAAAIQGGREADLVEIAMEIGRCR